MKAFVFICCILPCLTLAKNSFLVAPGIVEFDLKRSATQSFIITNDGDENIRLSIKPIYLDITDPSMAMGEHLSASTKTLEDITASLRVSPRRLSLKPGQRRDIRISIRPDPNLPPGDYRSHLLVQMRQIAHVISNPAQSGSDGVGMDINVKMETAIAIYGTKGSPAPRLDFRCRPDPTDAQLLIDIINPSPWRFDGPITISTDGTRIFNQRLVRLRGSSKAQRIETDYAPTTAYQISYHNNKDPNVKFTSGCLPI